MAYGIPLVEHLRSNKVIRGLQHLRHIAMPIVLIILPTHELVIEVYETLLDLCYTSKVRPIAIYGGAPADEQEKKLQQGCDILIATPGRLLHFLRRGLGKRQFISVEKVDFVVYDEADELLYEGLSSFGLEIDDIEKFLKHSRQFIYHWFFSSQFKDAHLERAEHIICSHGSAYFEHIDFDMPREDSSQRYTFVDQKFVYFDYYNTYKQKMDHVKTMLNRPGKILIIARKKRDVDVIEHDIMASHSDVKAEKTHGDLEQYHREVAMFEFKHGKVTVLVATAKLCGRGVNIAGIDDLIFWDLPDTLEEYMFQLGRVGRLGNTGRSTAFYQQEDLDLGQCMGRDMIRFLKKNNQPIPADLADYCADPPPDNSPDMPYRWSWDDEAAGRRDGFDAGADGAGAGTGYGTGDGTGTGADGAGDETGYGNGDGIGAGTDGADGAADS